MQKHPDLPKAFADLGVEAHILMALRKIGFEEPTDIQRELIPKILAGHDILGQARTGTGKTAAFGIPTLQLLDKGRQLQVLCLVPTRELAVQVSGEIRRLAEFTGLHCVPVYGGQRISHQIHKLGRKPHFVVGTPGRVLDFMGRRVLDISNIRFAILDEVDRMLDIGFRDDIRQILSRIKAKHTTVFVSATIDDEIRKLSLNYCHDPLEINVSRDELTVDEVDQSFVTAERPDKFRLLRLLLKHDKPDSVIIFTNTKAAARKLTQKLFAEGIDAMEIHGDLMQRKRDRVMEQFRKKRLHVLVATDLAARGIDVHHVTHIINYDLPPDPEVYVHRIGRTARMGARGKAISFVSREEGKPLTEIELLINKQIEERTYPGFKSSAPPEERPPEPVEQRVAEPATTVPDGNWMADEPSAPGARRTLGGRFKSSRRRRR